ncbi:putative mandelate racemase [Phycisphaera mikurensis NBRC 102666]|uniref:Putative mandelate racemase n=2 Tax=Phycisphaera TaxID=666508 RepID=I0IHG8_PHYMF|nr:putative mandelate racemase [Phycisphaera mikurensis NBRC 102666]
MPARNGALPKRAAAAASPQSGGGAEKLAIRGVAIDLYAVPLARVLVDAKHGSHSHFELVTVTITLADGSTGTGYTYTGGKGGHAIAAVLEHDLAEALLGKNGLDVEGVSDFIEWHLHYVGRGGIAAFAASAVDIALWDLAARRAGLPLWELLGGERGDCRVYHGGIDLAFTRDELIGSVTGAVERGFEGVKIKVGLPDLATDADRVRAVRAAIGDDVTFMVDANYAMSVDRAIAAARAFAESGILWFEEPTLPDDYLGFARIADATGVPLAMGENLHTIHEFGYAFDQAKLSYIQPDASNCGGITGWLRVAALAERHGIPVCSHGMHELHVSLVASQRHGGWMEWHSFPIEAWILDPVTLVGGRAVAPTSPGTGVDFDRKRLAPHRIGGASVGTRGV